MGAGSAEQVAAASASSERSTCASSCSSSISQSQCPVSQLTPGNGVTLATAFTVSLIDDDKTQSLQLHDNLGRFLPAALQLRSRTITRRQDVADRSPSAAAAMETTDAIDVRPSDHVTCERRRASANNNSSTTSIDDTNYDATTTDEQDSDSTNDNNEVTSEACTYTVDSADNEDVDIQRARTGIDDTFGVTTCQPSGRTTVRVCILGLSTEVQKRGLLV